MNPAPDPLLHGEIFTPALLSHALERNLDRPVLLLGEHEITGRELRDQIARARGVLADHGVGKHSPVALLSRNRPEVLVATGAAMTAGCRTTPLSPVGSAADHLYILRDAEIDTIVYDPDHFDDHVRELADALPGAVRLMSLGPSRHGIDLLGGAEREPPGPLRPATVSGEDISAIVYTGGTTGQPKGVMQTYRSGRTLAQIQLAEWDLPDRPRFLVCTPLSHAGAALVLPTLLRGGTLVVLPSFEPKAVLEAIERHRINALMLVPTMIYLLLEHPDLSRRDLSSLQRVYYGTAAMSPGRLAEAMRLLGPIFHQFYGQTECGMTISVLTSADHDADDPARLATCGRPVPWLDVRLLDDELVEVPLGEVGEICVRGPLVMRGYHNKPAESEEALRGGWLHTGDLARMDRDGYLTIVDRKKDMVITGGFNVFPREVEEVLWSHPEVAAAAVVGLPDDRWGEAVTAYVVLNDNADVDPEALRLLVREAKGPVQAPKAVHFVDALPLTPLGKVDKLALRSMAS